MNKNLFKQAINKSNMSESTKKLISSVLKAGPEDTKDDYPGPDRIDMQTLLDSLGITDFRQLSDVDPNEKNIPREVLSGAVDPLTGLPEEGVEGAAERTAQKLKRMAESQGKLKAEKQSNPAAMQPSMAANSAKTPLSANTPASMSPMTPTPAPATPTPATPPKVSTPATSDMSSIPPYEEVSDSDLGLTMSNSDDSVGVKMASAALIKTAIIKSNLHDVTKSLLMRVIK